MSTLPHLKFQLDSFHLDGLERLPGGGANGSRWESGSEGMCGSVFLPPVDGVIGVH